MESRPDYYSILDVNKNATAEEIRKAYYKISLKYHPDKNTSPEAEIKMKEINEAYKILSDTALRKRYDLSLSNSSNPMFNTHYQPQQDPKAVFLSQLKETLSTTYSISSGIFDDQSSSIDGTGFRHDYSSEFKRLPFTIQHIVLAIRDTTTLGYSISKSDAFDKIQNILKLKLEGMEKEKTTALGWMSSIGKGRTAETEKLYKDTYDLMCIIEKPASQHVHASSSNYGK